MDIEYIKDNDEIKNDEYIDGEIIADNKDSEDIARIAHEIFRENENFKDNGNVADDDFMQHIENQMCAQGYDGDTINDVKDIIIENYLD